MAAPPTALLAGIAGNLDGMGIRGRAASGAIGIHAFQCPNARWEGGTRPHTSGNHLRDFTASVTAVARCPPIRTFPVLIVRGCGSGAADARGSGRVVVVRKTLAKRLWLNEDALGKQLAEGIGPATDKAWTVAGIARHALPRADR